MTSKYTEIEIYKPITYNSYTAARYEVSNLGRVRNRRNGRILTNVARPAYASVILQIGNGQQKSFSCSRFGCQVISPKSERAS